MLVAEQSAAGVVHYRDAVLVAAALRDPDIASLLEETYISPLRDERSPLAETLIAFFGHEQNVSSAAAACAVESAR